MTTTHQSEHWPDVFFVHRDGAVIGVVRAVRGGFITRPRPVDWRPEADTLDDAIRIVEQLRVPAPPLPEPNGHL